MAQVDLAKLAAVIEQTLLKDRHYLQQRSAMIRSLLAKPDLDQGLIGKEMSKFESVAKRSHQILQSRQKQQLDIQYPEQLPVSERRKEIAQLIEKHPVVILAGETGSGKTTQLGKLCLELGRGRFGQIAHTQPRRVAATSVAKRIAEELNQPLGQSVGYQIRFKAEATEATVLKLMTDGVLLAEIAKDRRLMQYDTLIIDEAHERSLNIDFILGYIKQLLPQRPELKVIITSATIDVEGFSSHFDQAPVIEISGRTFAVEKRYCSVASVSEENDINQAIACVLETIEREEKQSGQVSHAKDVLVFLPGENDIRQASLALRKSSMRMDVLPLYARLNPKEHGKIFNPPKQSLRRVILATNVAETSLTVPGIGYVIDSGLARISRYSTRAKVQRLPIEKIAKSSADQRAGRCGRIAAGICYRLYSEDDFNTRPDFTEPEIQRTNLSQVILQMHALGLGDIARFAFIQPPEQKLINDGVKQLIDLAALDERKRLTPMGRKMVRWPLDPKLSRMMIAAEASGCTQEMLIIASALATQDPRENPSDKKEAAREKHKQFAHEQSDFFGLMQLWDEVEEQRQDLSSNQFRKYCSRNFLSWQRLKEWRDVHKQLRLLAKESGAQLNQEPAAYSEVHKAILTGVAAQIGMKDEKVLYQGTRNRQFRLFPNTSIYKKSPKWVVVGELLETSQLYGHRAAKIEPEWVIDAAPQLLKYEYIEPHFSRKQGRVAAFQKTSLYGLVLEDKKRVGYADIDRKVSRELFIRQGLVEGQLVSRLPFYQHNQKLRGEIEALEEKQRRRDLLANDDDIFDFYNHQLPENIHNLKSLETFCKNHKNKKVLFAGRDVFLKEILDENAQDFPAMIAWENVEYSLSYKFQPGKVDDGVCVRLPVATLNRVPRHLFEWLVPGLFKEKCEALLKTLPKQIRRNLVPVPDTVAKLMPLLKKDNVSLTDALIVAIRKQKGLTITPADFQREKLDNYYLPLFELRDDKNNVVEISRDLSGLIKDYGHKVQQALDKKVDKQKSAPAKRWEFGDIEQKQQFKQSGTWMTSFPALEDCGDAVRLKLTDYPDMQMKVHRKGLVRLARLYLPQQVKYLKKQIFSSNAMQLKLTAEFEPQALKEDLLAAAFNHCFLAGNLPFDQASFEQGINKRKQDLASVASHLEKTVQLIMDSDYDVRVLLSKLTTKTYKPIVNDIVKQRKRLLYQGFIYSTPIDYFNELPRYFLAIKQRLEKVGQQLSKDLPVVGEFMAIDEKIAMLTKDCPEIGVNEHLIKYQWMLEEYRVSLFAQQLKTKYPISKKRLEKQWTLIIQSLD